MNRIDEIVKQLIVERQNYDRYELLMQEADEIIAELEDEMYDLENYED